MYQAKSGVKIFSLYQWGREGGGVPQQKIFFSSLKMYQAKSGVKIFSLYQWGGGGVPQQKIFFSCLNMYQAKSGVKNFSLYWCGGSLDGKFFSQSEDVSSQICCQKIFPLLGGGPSTKIFFFQSEHVSS